MTFPSCPVPLPSHSTVLLGHGSGGKLSAELMRSVFLPLLGNPILDRLEDQATVNAGGLQLAMTTDSFVVKPRFFPGGDIGSLSVHGTINDLAIGGATPLCLTAAFILEEGLGMDELRRIVESMGRAAHAAGVSVVAGDTKVVEHGTGDGVYITTTGIGLVRPGLTLSASSARPGDAVLLSGSIGDHGMCILSQREMLQFGEEIESDSAAIHSLAAAILDASEGVRCMRDPTRGGLAGTLNEIAAQSQVEIEIEDDAIVVHDNVRSACEVLGLDPLFVANEGKLVTIVAPEDATRVLSVMRVHPLGAESAIIGRVLTGEPGLVSVRTPYGTARVVGLLAGDQLPRIC